MRKITSEISYLESAELASAEKSIIFGDEKLDYSFLKKLISRYFKWKFDIKKGIFYAFSFKESLYDERVVLETLKQKEIVESYGEGPIFCDYPRFYFFGTYIHIKKGVKKIRSWGYALPFEERSMALKKSLWEAIERQASYYYKGSTTVTYPNLRIGNASFLYDLIPKFTHHQLKLDSRLVSSKEDMEQMTGFNVESLTGDKKRFLPGECFYWGDRLGDNEKVFQESTTSGSGGGTTKEYATLSALYELIERDLYLLFWYAKVAPKLIDVREEEGELYEYIRDAKERFNLEIYFFDIRYDINIPSCMCIVVDPVLNFISTGGKVSFDAVSALQGAFMEALAIMNSARSRAENDRVSEDRLQEIMATLCDSRASVNKTVRMNMYCSKLGIKMVKDFWIENNTKIVSFKDFDKNSMIFGHKKEELAYIVLVFKKLVKEKGEGYHIYRHHFSSVFAHMYNYSVVHVFVPSFLKLHLNEAYAALVSPRLKEFARLHRAAIKDEDDINSLPHFLP